MENISITKEEELFRKVLLDFLVFLPLDEPLNTLSYKTAMDLIDKFMEEKGLVDVEERRPSPRA